jgi:predicted ATPase
MPPIPRPAAARYRGWVLIPETVRATVLGRIRLMERTERAIVMCASVIGRRFEVAVLTEAAACDEAPVRAALERACALQLIVADDSPEWFAFRHALTRDVIYAELVNAPIRPMHRRIARALERSPMIDQPLEDLAYHAWAGGDLHRALRYNELAGDRAAAVHATADAQTYYARARGLFPVDSDAYARLTEKMDALGEAEHASPR